jgi:hypothetical protein
MLELWNRNCFLKTSLFDQGFVLWVGHGGLACPATESDIGFWEDIPLGDDEDTLAGHTVSEANHSHDVVVVTDITGVFQHHVAWCTCDGVPDKPMQLFQEQIFPASYTQVKSAFTFNVLDHFYFEVLANLITYLKMWKLLCRFCKPYKRVLVSGDYFESLFLAPVKGTRSLFQYFSVTRNHPGPLMVWLDYKFIILHVIIVCSHILPIMAYGLHSSALHKCTCKFTFNIHYCLHTHLQLIESKVSH